MQMQKDPGHLPVAKVELVFYLRANTNPGNRVQQPRSVLRLKACAHLSITEIFKIVISSDCSFDWLYGDMYFCIVLLKVIRVETIFQETPPEGLRLPYD